MAFTSNMTSTIEEENENWMPFRWIEGDTLAPPCQSCPEVVHEIIALANISPSDVLYDLGCGDGRICLTASTTHGIRSVGIEIEADLIDRFRKNIVAHNVEHLVEAHHRDLLASNLDSASVIVTYLLPEAMDIIAKRLIEALERGCRVICSTFLCDFHDLLWFESCI